MATTKRLKILQEEVSRFFVILNGDILALGPCGRMQATESVLRFGALRFGVLRFGVLRFGALRLSTGTG